jgi:RES domain-containing protein
MEFYRIAQAKYADTLNASGKEGRWNKDNQFVIYCSHSLSLATLEKLVAFGGIQPFDQFKLMVINVMDESAVESLSLNDLPSDWQKVSAYHKLHRITSAWYTAQKSLIMKVPSAIIPQEINVVINTRHPEFINNVTIRQTENYFWDQRLF